MKKIPNLIPMLCIMALCYFGGMGKISVAQEGPFIAGQASWYAQTDPGVLQTTSNMERFNDQGLTCAMWDVPFNTLIKVTNKTNGKSVVVRVNDRGPAKRLVSHGRVIDLTKKAFSNIADLKEGLVEVEAIILPKTP